MDEGYQDSYRDFKRLDGHGYNDSTRMMGVDKDNCVAGYHIILEDTKRKKWPFC